MSSRVLLRGGMRATTSLLHTSLFTRRGSSLIMLACLKLFTFGDESSCPKLIGPLDAPNNENYMDLHHLLEDGFVVD